MEFERDLEHKFISPSKTKELARYNVFFGFLGAFLFIMIAADVLSSSVSYVNDYFHGTMVLISLYFLTFIVGISNYNEFSHKAYIGSQITLLILIMENGIQSFLAVLTNRVISDETYTIFYYILDAMRDSEDYWRIIYVIGLLVIGFTLVLQLFILKESFKK